MAKTSTYWDKRAIKRLTQAEKSSEEYINRIKKMYDQANKDLDREIAKIYKNYSKETGIDVQTLKQLLTHKETSKVFKELKAKGYDKYVRDNYKSRITRLEQIKAQIYDKAKEVYTKEELLNHDCYKNVVNNSYYKSIYDTQMGTGYDFSFNKLDDNLLNSLLRERWSGKNYSQRIWGNTDILAESVSEIVGGALLSGQSISKTAKQIKDRYGVSKYYAERLVRTETNHFNNEADAMAYEEMGVNEYVFVAVLDSRTSPMCQDHDNKVYKYKDREVGVNYPPLHPNCRSTTRGYLGKEAEKMLKRRARDPQTGKSELIDNMSYKEWAKQKGIIETPKQAPKTKRDGQLPTKPVVDTSKSVKIEPKIEKNAIKPLTEDGKKAIEYYVSGEGMYINDYLRDRNNPIERMGAMTDFDKKLIKDLDTALDNPIGENITLYRSVDASAIFGEMEYNDYDNLKSELLFNAYSKDKGAYSQNIYKNVKAKMDSVIGKTIEDKGFMSTSKSYDVVKNWGDFTGSEKPIVLELNTPSSIRGRDLLDFDIKGDEQKEVLLARGVKYKVTGIEAKDGNIYVKADVIAESRADKVISLVADNNKVGKMTLDNVPYDLRTSKEAKNTQLFIDAVNNPKADPKVADVYKRMASTCNVDFKVSHAKKSSISYKENRATGNYYNLKLTIPNIKDANDMGSINTVLHENMHLIDLCKGSGTTNASVSSKLMDIVKATDRTIGDDIKPIFNEFNELCKQHATEIKEAYKPMYAKLNEQYRAGTLNYKEYHKQWLGVNKLWREAQKEAEFVERNYMGGGVSTLQDIYDALSGGSYRDCEIVHYGHGTRYYRTYDKRVKEIVANYGALSITRPDLIELLKADKPALVKALDEFMDSLL